MLTEIGKYKVSQLEVIAANSKIQEILKSSNEDFSAMSPEVLANWLDTKEKEWIRAPTDEPTPFMVSIINNSIADFLRNNLVVESESFGQIIFGEFILTNTYGPNVAVTVRTDNYNQKNDDWWQRVKETGLLVRQCVWDESAKMPSEDIVIRILDEKGEFLGIINSATPCNVIEYEVTEDISEIEIVGPENITPIGNHKISLLKQLMSDPSMQETLRSSNEEFAAMGDLDMLELREKIDWPPPSVERPTELQLSILNNDAADILRENIVFHDEEFGEIIFAEHILTNAYGANVAITERTYNYIQSPEEWWIKAKDNEILIRQCGFDVSVKMWSEDIILAIYDDKEEFVGVLNTATSCNVIEKKSPFFEGDSN
jgi:hypothetical protein